MWKALVAGLFVLAFAGFEAKAEMSPRLEAGFRASRLRFGSRRSRKSIGPESRRRCARWHAMATARKSPMPSRYHPSRRQQGRRAVFECDLDAASGGGAQRWSRRSTRTRSAKR